MSEQVQEEFVEGPMPPVIETVLHNAALEVRKVPVPGAGEMTLLRFHTPAIIYTVKLDEGGVNALISGLRGGAPEIAIASPQAIPDLRARGA